MNDLVHEGYALSLSLSLLGIYHNLYTTLTDILG